MITPKSMTPAPSLCGAHRLKGEHLPCRRPSGWGTSHPGWGSCKLHGGAAPGPTKHANKLEAQWRQRLVDELDPSIRVLSQLRDGVEVADRDRIKAASVLLAEGSRLTEAAGGKIELTITWPQGL